MPTTRSPGSRSGCRPTAIDWSHGTAASRGTIAFRIPNVPSGLYYVQFDGGGRPRRLRAVRRPPGDARRRPSRVLVVLPTNTWQAYNFQDVERQRLRRHVVRRAAEPRRRPRPHVHRARCPAALLPLRPAVPALALLVGEERRVHLRLRLRHDRERRRSRARVRPGRLRGARGVRDDARVRRRHALPRSRRQPDVPLGEQLLLEGRQAGAGAAQDRHSGADRPAGGRADRRPVPRERRRPATGALHCAGLGDAPRGSGTAPASSTARRSGSSSAATGSRSTQPRPIRRPGRWCSPRSRISSARASRPR